MPERWWSREQGGVAVLTMASPRPTWHQPVMGAEALHALAPRPGAVIVDGTVGTGGHSLMLLPHLLPDGRLIAVDRDGEALQLAKARLAEFEPQVTFVHANYRHLPGILKRQGLTTIDGLLLDLGMSSVQVDDAERGFSFSHEGPLDMRMDREEDASAGAVVSALPADDLAKMFEALGEERFSRRIAQRIVDARRMRPIDTTVELAGIIAGAVPPGARHGRLHPATRAFQALRMAVNDELGALQELLEQLPAILAPGARAVLLTFHSLEDRLVKRAFVDGSRDGRWNLLTKKPLRPSADEVARNPRARSAKLRAIEVR